ncbi:MAG: HEPN domain-containing protein [Candidatus Poribacteria bacterium]|nr:HEPN domain-containing protein [Candidatus Poribacteria bacterium]
MTEKSKVELNQLLNEAMEGLQIGIRSEVNSLLLSLPVDGDSTVSQLFFGNASLPLSEVKLRGYLQQRWGSYGIDSSSIVMYLRFYMANQTTESKLLAFIGRELEPFIHEEKVNSPYSASYAITYEKDGFRLHTIRAGVIGVPYLLEHLLKIAVTYGVEKAVSTFDEGSSLKGKQGFYQDIVSLEGIVVEEEIQVCEGVKLVPFPQSTTFEFESYFPGHSIRDSRFARQTNMGKTLLIIDCPLLSIFHKSSHESFDGMLVGDLPFQIETDNIKFSNHDEVNSFRELFCQALSLACNSPVQIAFKWWFLTEDDLFHPFPGGGMGYSPRLFGGSVKAGQSEIDKAKCLYRDLINLNSKAQGKLKIAINRWIKSKTHQTPEDKIIDLAIAFETLYLPDSGESTYKLGVRASWSLGDKKKDREDLLAVFKKFYKFRSRVVHGGEPNEKENVTIKDESIPISQFVTKVQNLCLESIEKIMSHCLKDKEFLSSTRKDNEYWDSLILGTPTVDSDE